MVPICGHAADEKGCDARAGDSRRACVHRIVQEAAVDKAPDQVNQAAPFSTAKPSIEVPSLQVEHEMACRQGAIDWQDLRCKAWREQRNIPGDPQLQVPQRRIPTPPAENRRQ
ncbi:hypothetical protein [Chitinivorax sp. B]|uniref:hypothetical protein n=1 Tax=Chitinivorax sp. B TaxID=2502235 RepID=UPI0010F6BA6B|nr:hypothetical protein [Chitinivorax sp. B]